MIYISVVNNHGLYSRIFNCCLYKSYFTFNSLNCICKIKEKADIFFQTR